MFDLGFWEIIIILVIVVVFIRPKDLPLFLRNLGMLYRRLRDFSIDVIKIAVDIESEMKSSLSDSEANMGSTMSLKEEVEPFDERESGMDSAIEINETIKEKKDI